MFANAQHHLSGAQTVGMASHGDDRGLFVEFSIEAVLQPFESEKQGRPIYKDTPYVTIHFPGDKTKKFVGPVEDQHRERFPRQWAAFEAQEAQAPEGMPVTEWAPLTRSQAQELKAINIHTVEQLAAMPDSACTWLGSRDLRTKAQTWLESAAGHSQEAHLQQQLAQRDAQIAALQAQIDDIVARAGENAPSAAAAPISRRSSKTPQQENA